MIELHVEQLNNGVIQYSSVYTCILHVNVHIWPCSIQNYQIQQPLILYNAFSVVAHMLWSSNKQTSRWPISLHMFMEQGISKSSLL